MSLADILNLLLPQLILLVTGLAILIGDLIGSKAKKTWPPYLALVGLVAAMIVAALQWGRRPIVPGWYAAGRCVLDLLRYAGARWNCALVVLSAISYLRERVTFRSEFYGLIVFVAMAMSLAVAAGNLIMVYVAMETISITSYISGRLSAGRQEVQRSGHEVLPVWRGKQRGDAVWHVTPVWRDWHDGPGRHGGILWRRFDCWRRVDRHPFDHPAAGWLRVQDRAGSVPPVVAGHV